MPGPLSAADHRALHDAIDRAFPGKLFTSGVGNISDPASSRLRDRMALRRTLGEIADREFPGKPLVSETTAPAGAEGSS